MSNPRFEKQTSQERSTSTKASLLDAASALFSEKGVNNVSLREITERAGQKNASALQYHFGSKDNLIKELHIRHYKEELAHRAAMAPEIMKPGDDPTARMVATLIVRSCVTLLQSNEGYRRWMACFGHEFAQQGLDAIRESEIDTSSDMTHIVANLMSALPHIDPNILFHRLDQVTRFVALQLSLMARDQDRLHGAYADISLAMLVDAVCGLLEADVSPETKQNQSDLRDLLTSV